MSFLSNPFKSNTPIFPAILNNFLVNNLRILIKKCLYLALVLRGLKLTIIKKEEDE